MGPKRFYSEDFSLCVVKFKKLGFSAALNYCFLKFNFVIISTKKHNLVKSLIFRSPVSKIKGRWRRRARRVWRF